MFRPLPAALLLVLIPMSAASSAPTIRPFSLARNPPGGCLFFTADEAAKRGGRKPVLVASGEPMPASVSMNLRGRVETLHLSGLSLEARPAAVGALWKVQYVTDDRAFALRLESQVVALGGEPGSTAEAATLTLIAGVRTVEVLQVTGYCF